MNERKQLWVILEAMLVCVIFASLYAIGGSGDFWGGQKWLRRFLAPGLFGVWAFVRGGLDWRYLVQMGPMMGALCLPYGADSTAGKVALRAVFGLANGAAGSIVNAWSKRWSLVVLQMIIVPATSVLCGVWNQTPNAMAEQFIIGMSIVFIPALTVRPKK